VSLDPARLERRAQTVLESITEPFYHLDEHWCFAFINQRALDYLGRTRESLIGQNLWDVFPKTLNSEFGEQFTRAVQHGTTAEFETLSPLTGRVVEVRAYPSAEGLSVSFRDVTERRRAETRDRFLIALDDATRGLVDPEEIARTAATLLGSQLGVDRCAYVDGHGDAVTFDVTGHGDEAGSGRPGHYALSSFGEEFERISRSGVPFVVEDVATDRRTAAARESYRQAGIGALVSVSLLKSGKFAGGMAVYQKTPRRWESNEIDLVALVAHRSWESLERARLTRTLVRKTRAFSVLADNGTRLLAEEHPQALIDAIFHKATEIANVDLCLHFLLTPDRNRLQLAESYGLPEGIPPDLPDVQVGDGACATTVADNAPLVRNLLQESTDSADSVIRALGVRAYACFPLSYGGALIGTLSFGTRLRDAFTEDDLEFLHALSDQVAAAYGRARGATALRESEERLLQAAAIAGLGTFDTDLSTLAMAVNEPGRGIYGWAPDVALTFASAQAQFHPDDRERVVRTVRAAFEESGAEAFDIEHRIVRTDGAVRWIRVRGRALFDWTEGERRATRCLGTFVDITDRKETEERRERILRTERAGREEAERLGRLKDEFLATVSHELRTPLNAILGWSQLLRRRPMGLEETRSAIEVIDRNARAQAQLIDDLLDMSRFASGSIRVDMHHVDPAMVVSTAVQSIQPSADAKHIQLQQQLRTGGATVFGDAVRLQQVVWNLLSNALKFTPPGGSIDVRLERIGCRVDLTVRDTGTGIQPDFLPHIFEPFRQQDASTTRRHGGVGLGLSIVKQLVEIHAGEVRATSAGQGKGATFVVSLPVSSDWEVTLAPSPGPLAAESDREIAATKPLHGLRVMAVEDEPDALALLERVLADAGAEVVGVTSAEAALEHLRQQCVDLLISDIGMPEVDGYDLIRAVRAFSEPALARVPAIAVSAYARTQDGERALEAGYQRYLAKPLDVPELLAVAVDLAGRSSRG
jgi:PAS domain S-box-containing protein